MKAQRDELFKRLSESGWKVIEDFEPDRDVKCYEDWADEILTVESVWSPLGFKAYIYFLVDPMHFAVRRKGENVWAIGVSIRFDNLRQRPDSLMFEFPINKGHWKDSLQKVLETLNEFRQTAVNETSLV